MISLDNNITYFIESKNIRVFPCAYRGYYETTNGGEITTLVFDPEARSTTESNFTETFHKLSNNKDSYVIEWKPASVGSLEGTLKCVIGGYYFEIFGQKISDFFSSTGKPYYLSIKTATSDLSTSENDGDRQTRVLTSFTETTNYLDIKVGSTTNYIFTGLIISSSSPENVTASLKPFIADYKSGATDKIEKGGTYSGYYYLDPADNLYKALPTTSILAGDSRIGKQYYTRTLKVDPCQLPITGLLDIGQGEYSIRLFENSTTTGTNNTEATGDYSVALGKSTKTTGEASAAFGDQSEALEKGAFVAGIGTKASGEGAVAFGNGSQATAKGTFAAGNSDGTNPTKATAEGAVAIGNKASASARGAIALGNATNASEEGAVALGNAAKAKAGGAVAMGNNTTANNPGSVALGNNTTTNADNQMVIGAYNDQDSDKIFIIANGTDKFKTNTFTVSYNGDVKALGNLEVNGNTTVEIDGEPTSFPAISSKGAGQNSLVLGTAAADSSGSIMVHGTGKNETAFRVDNSGKTTIKGDTKIRSKSNSTKPSEGALVVQGGVGVGENLNVSKNLNVGQNLTVNENTTLKNTLDVTGNTTVEGTLNVTRGTTLASTLGVTEDTTLGGALAVTGATAISSNLTVNGTTTLKGEFIVTNSDSNKNFLRVQLKKDKDDNDRGLVAIAHELTVGGNTELNSCVIKSETASESTETGALTIKGGLGVAGTIYAKNIVTTNGTATQIKDETKSTSTSSGALVVAGGVGIGENLNVGGDVTLSKKLSVSGTGAVEILKTGAASLTLGSETEGQSGQLFVYGSEKAKVFSVSNAGATTIAGVTIIENSTGLTLSSPTDGALRVAGGISTGNNLYVAGEAKINNKLVAGSVTIQGAAVSGISDLTLTGQLKANTISTDGAITAKDQITAPSFNANSDQRLKCNIEDYRFKKSILDLPIKRFEYIKDNSHTKYIGCLAQDLSEICPELVNTTKDGMLSIQESKLIYALIQEVKELKAKVELLERR